MPSRVEQFQALAGRQPDNELFRFSLAQALVADHRAAEAVAHYEFCVAKKTDWMMPRILLGKVQLELGRHAEARPLLQDAPAPRGRAAPRGSRTRTPRPARRPVSGTRAASAVERSFARNGKK